MNLQHTTVLWQMLQKSYYDIVEQHLMLLYLYFKISHITNKYTPWQMPQKICKPNILDTKKKISC